MKTFLAIFTALFFISIQTPSFAQTAEEMKAWTEYMTPGPVHEMLAKSDGEWNEELTFWMTPDGPPTKSTATAVNKMIMGGRYQLSNHTGNMFGMPFEGVSIIGYDNAKKKFVSTWYDNFGTGIMYMEGPWDEASKSVTFTGTGVDPMTGKDCQMRQVFTIIDDKTQKIEMYDNKTGTEVKSMEIILTKK